MHMRSRVHAKVTWCLESVLTQTRDLKQDDMVVLCGKALSVCGLIRKAASQQRGLWFKFCLGPFWV